MVWINEYDDRDYIGDAVGAVVDKNDVAEDGGLQRYASMWLILPPRKLS